MTTREFVGQWVAFPAALLGSMIVVNAMRGQEPLIDWVLALIVFAAYFGVKILSRPPVERDQ